MTKTTQEYKIVYAVYPNANGFGFVYMANGQKLLDYGSVRISPINNQRILDRIKKSFQYFRPSIVILLDPDCNSSRTGNRVRRLINKIVLLAHKEKLPVKQYSRDRIREVFELNGSKTKYEISQKLVKGFEELESIAPKQRNLWDSEDRNMVIFDALSLAITWYYLNP